jgi:hypothetical protein
MGQIMRVVVLKVKRRKLMEKKEEIVDTTAAGGRLLYLNDELHGIEFHMKDFEVSLRDDLCHCYALEKRIEGEHYGVHYLFREISTEYYHLKNNNLENGVLFPRHIPQDEKQPVYPHPGLPFRIQHFVADHRMALDRFFQVEKEKIDVEKSITPAIRAICGRPISRWYVEQHKVTAIFK